MVRDWNEIFSEWSRAPGDTEKERIEHAEVAVRNALMADDTLRPITRVFVQGSYRNRVNVRQDSDVDLGVLYTGNSFFTDYPDGMESADFGNTSGDYSYGRFKDDVEAALDTYFGSAAVGRGRKAFDIHENTHRVDADVAPFFVHRRYRRNGSHICGVELRPDNGGRVVNWPERLNDDGTWPDQHYENGVAKNTETYRAYKGVVRILKSLRNEMDEDAGVPEAKPISGFLVECLVWNVLSALFSHETWDGDVQATLDSVWTATRTDAACAEWGEVSELKYLFKGLPTKRRQAHEFIAAAWDYIGVRL